MTQTFRPEIKIYIQQAPSAKKNDIYCRCCDDDTKKNLTIHHVVPRIIGKFIDHNEFLKCKTVILCKKCHSEYESIVNTWKYEYRKHFRFNLGAKPTMVCPILKKIKSSANLLLMNVDTASGPKIHKAIDNIKSYLSKDHYTANDLMVINEIDINIPDPAFKHIGEHITSNNTTEEIKEFWYNHYNTWESMKTKHILNDTLIK